MKTKMKVLTATITAVALTAETVHEIPSNPEKGHPLHCQVEEIPVIEIWYAGTNPSSECDQHR